MSESLACRYKYPHLPASLVPIFQVRSTLRGISLDPIHLLSEKSTNKPRISLRSMLHDLLFRLSNLSHWVRVSAFYHESAEITEVEVRTSSMTSHWLVHVEARLISTIVTRYIKYLEQRSPFDALSNPQSSSVRNNDPSQNSGEKGFHHNRLFLKRSTWKEKKLSKIKKFHEFALLSQARRNQGVTLSAQSNYIITYQLILRRRIANKTRHDQHELTINTYQSGRSGL